MQYQFPEIHNIKDVLPAIEGVKEFIIADRGPFKIVNYVVTTQDTFPDVIDENPFHAIRRECRGLVFDTESGNILSRRYHKFFNLNERVETSAENVDFNKPHHILEKLDGSMVSPLVISSAIRLLTKMGITDTAMEAEVFLARNKQYKDFIVSMLKQGVTPIFEWVSRRNRIVIDYDQDNLILTAVRANVSGKYLPCDAMKAMADQHMIPVVKAYKVPPTGVTVEYIIDTIRRAENTEGIVIRFEDGHMLKVKSEWYTRLHKSKAALSSEKSVIALWLGLSLDDVVGFLDAVDRNRINTFVTSVQKHIEWWCVGVESYIKELRGSHISRKDYALKEMPKNNKLMNNIIFKLWDSNSFDISERKIYDIVVEGLKTASSKEDSYQFYKTQLWPTVHMDAPKAAILEGDDS